MGARLSERPRVYTTFDASHSKNPARTDLKYYFLLRAWLRRGALAGAFIDVHQAAPRGTFADLRGELGRRLQESDMLLLLLSEHSPKSTGWLSWEIEHGVTECRLPVLCAYTGRERIDARTGFAPWWPSALRHALSRPGAHAFHVPFRASDVARGVQIGSVRP